VGAIGGVCPFLTRRCSCKSRAWLCDAVNPVKTVDKENCVDFLDCLIYQEKMVKVRKYL